MIDDKEEQEEKNKIVEEGNAKGKTPVEIVEELNKRLPPPVLDIGKRSDPKLLLVNKEAEEEVEGFVTMQGGYDSAIACIAMVTRKEYKDVSPCVPRKLSAKFKDVPGSGRIALQPHEIMRILYEFGILARQVTCQNLYKDHPTQSWRSKHANAIYEYTISDLQAYLMLGGKAMLGVPGHENANLMHWIYAESAMAVFDPYPIKTDRYKTLDKLMIADAIIVGGVPDGKK